MMNPAVIIAVANMMLYVLNLRKTVHRIIDRPIQCSIPKRTGRSGITSSVTAVMAIPRLNIHRP